MTRKRLKAMLAERFQMLELCREDNARGTEGNHPAGSDPEDPPKALPVERLLSDGRALDELTAPRDPPRVRLRAREVLQAIYLTGDASGAWFGSAVICTKGIMVYESGTWNKDWANDSSNLWEVDNLVIKIEALVKEGEIK